MKCIKCGTGDIFKFKSVKANRGNDGQGTKKEGKRNYKIKK